MEIVLLENIKNLGKIGDTVKVKRGYGRNFLIKYGKALKASKENLVLVNKKKMFDKKKHGLFIMPKYRSIDINDLSEVKIVESLLKVK